MSELTKPIVRKNRFLSKDWIFKNNKIYIVPTRYGLLYLIVIIIMVLTGATYSNNLIYLLGFFLFSVFVSGMVQTHSNISGVEVQVSLIEDCYEGETNTIDLLLKNKTKNLKQTVRVQLAGKTNREEIPAKADIVAPHKSVSASFEMGSDVRGKYTCPKLKLYTNFPLGLFQSWVYQDSDVHYYVYPKPKNFTGSTYQMIGESDNLLSRQSVDKKADSDFCEHRQYRQGESYRHIDWKAYARKRPLLVKIFEGNSGIQKVFDFSKLVHLPAEQRLQQLSFWVTESLRANELFQIVLPDQRTAMGSGVAHARSCLRAVAVFAKGSQNES